MEKKILVVILFVLCLPLQMKAQTTLNGALQYLQQRNYIAALEICDKLLADSGNDPSVLGVRSQVYTAMGKYEQAMQDAEKALSANNTSDRAHFAKAEALHYGQKDHNSALMEYEAAIRSNPQMTAAYAGKARAYMGLQNYKEALKVTEESLNISPNDPELYYIHGLLNFQRGKPKLAVDDYDKVLTLDPTWNPYQVYLNRGFANDALHNNELAIQDFSSAVAADPNGSAAYIARGNSYYLMSKYKESVVDFKKAEVLSPDNSVITYNIGMAYYKDEDKTTACKFFQKSCSQGNNNACKMVLLNCSDRKLN